MMVWMPPPGGIALCQGDGLEGHHRRGGIHMSDVTIIGLDLAKRVFHLPDFGPSYYS